MGAAIVDIALILREALLRIRRRPGAARREVDDWKRVNTARLVLWVLVWGAGIVATGHLVLEQPVGFLVFAVALVFVFALVNGISLGISDSNPISSAFVVTVVLMAALGLEDPTVGLMAGTVLLVSTSVACDMQQDRSTGWRLGTQRMLQFRYQVVGIVMGAMLAVGFAKLFMTAYPVLRLDQTVMKAGEQPAEWSAAMTYKFVGVLRSLTDDKPYQRTAIWLGVALGFAIEVARKLIKANAPLPALRRRRPRPASPPTSCSTRSCCPRPTRRRSAASSTCTPRSGSAPAASSPARSTRCTQRRTAGSQDALPSDMSTTSLVGGGLIAGDSLAALGLGIAGLLATVLR